jgi:outer membrane lipoprotein-sorting protein
MMTVEYFARDGSVSLDEYAEVTIEAKVLGSGVLKIVKPDEHKVPMLGEDGETIMVRKGKTLAIYNGEYIIRRA